MKRGLWSRILAFIGIEEEWETDTPPDSPQESKAAAPSPRGRKGALLSLPGGQTFRVVVAKPESFAEVQAMADQIKAGRPLVLNLENTPSEARSRIVNFLTGVIYAVDGQMQRVGGGILLFAPHNVDVEYVGQSEDGEDSEDMDTV